MESSLPSTMTINFETNKLTTLKSGNQETTSSALFTNALVSETSSSSQIDTSNPFQTSIESIIYSTMSRVRVSATQSIIEF